MEALLRDDDYDGHDQLDCFGAARDVLLFVGVVKGIVGNTFAMAITKNDKLCRFVDRASDGLASVWFVQGGELFIALRPPTDLGATLVSRMVKQHPFKYSGTAGEFSICKVVELSFDALDARANDVAHLLLCSLTADKEACSVVYDSLKQDAERAWEPFTTLLPVGMFHAITDIKNSIRPMPEWVVDSKYAVHKFRMKTGTEAGDLAAYSARVLLFPGVSGKGKTFAAVTLADDTIRALCGSGFESATVLGCYAVAKRNTCVAKWAAETVRKLFKTRCEHPGEFGKLAVHVVLDEVGGLPDIVRGVVTSAPELTIPSGDAALNSTDGKTQDTGRASYVDGEALQISYVTGSKPSPKSGRAESNSPPTVFV